MAERQRITEMTDFSTAPGGYEVNFSLRTEDGATMQLACPQERVGQAIVGLLRAQEAAGQERAKGGDANLLLAAPLQTVELAVGITPGGQGILLQLKAQSGLVLDYELPVALGTQLAEGIAQALRVYRNGLAAGPTH